MSNFIEIGQAVCCTGDIDHLSGNILVIFSRC